uniref:Putative secreted protein n=1 Tax=Panstrongylus lignarius TaxID=156445 RepID=A0A224Y5K0_9HEMI
MDGVDITLTMIVTGTFLVLLSLGAKITATVQPCQCGNCLLIMVPTYGKRICEMEVCLLLKVRRKKLLGVIPQAAT